MIKLNNVNLQSMRFSELVSQSEPNYALSFDGVNDYVDCGDLGAQTTTGTIEFWMLTNVIASYPNTLSTNFSGVNNAIRFEVNSSGQYRVYIGNSSDYESHVYTSSLSTSTWYHVALVWDFAASNVKGYLDGTLAFNEIQSQTPSNMSDFNIGRGWATSRYWDGKVSDLRLWNTTRTQTEIQNNMNNTLQGTETGLGTYYPMKEGAGTTLYDYAGTNNGIINGPTWVEIQ